jgi:SAM-dependent methyltransferase
VHRLRGGDRGAARDPYRRSAELYDLIYAGERKDYRAESDAVAALITERAPHARTLLDVGCGTGLHLEHLVRRFAHVEGCDVSSAMLRIARRRLPGVRLTRADMRTLELGHHFDAVVCLFSAIGYVTDRAELRATWRRLAAHLLPGGVAVVDGWVRPSAWIEGNRPMTGVAADESRVVVRMDHSSRDGDITTLSMHHLVGTVDGIEDFVEHHVMRLVEDEEHVDAMRAAGLRAEVVEGITLSRSRFVGVREH